MSAVIRSSRAFTPLNRSSHDVKQVHAGMAKVTGVGGVFFKANNPNKLYAWYEKHLGIVREHGFVSFPGPSTASPWKTA
jgi:hypothetical protein